MKFLLKNFTLRHYIRHVRKQSKHVQHVHAFIFAGAITAVIAGFILYTDYGFWHERYVAEEETEESFDPKSPAESFAGFWAEAGKRFNLIGAKGANLLEGKETYKKEE